MGYARKAAHFHVDSGSEKQNPVVLLQIHWRQTPNLWWQNPVRCAFLHWH